MKPAWNYLQALEHSRGRLLGPDRANVEVDSLPGQDLRLRPDRVGGSGVLQKVRTG